MGGGRGDQVRPEAPSTLSTERIGKKIGVVHPEELAHIIDGLNEIIGA